MNNNLLSISTLKTIDVIKATKNGQTAYKDKERTSF